jgi:type IV secretion system protein VirB1
MDMMACPGMAVPAVLMQHVVDVESSFNPYAIGVVGGRLARQPRNMGEAIATARMLEREGFDFSLGLAQVNRSNLAHYGLASYAQAFDACRNVRAGSRILAECHARSGNDWGKALSCYYSGDFVTGFRQGYVQKVFASIQASLRSSGDLGGRSRAGDGVATAGPSPSGSPPPSSRQLERLPGTAGRQRQEATSPRPAQRLPVVVTIGAAVPARPADIAARAQTAAADAPTPAVAPDQAFVF